MSVSVNLHLLSGACNFTHGQSRECAYLSISIVTALGGIHLSCHDSAAVAKAALILHRQTQLRQRHGLKVCLGPTAGHEGLQSRQPLCAMMKASSCTAWACSGHYIWRARALQCYRGCSALRQKWAKRLQHLVSAGARAFLGCEISCASTNH